MRHVILLAALVSAAAQAGAAPQPGCSAGVLFEQAKASGSRTVILSDACGPARQVIITTGPGQGVSVNVIVRRQGASSGPARIVKVADRPDFAASSAARIIRVGQ